MKTKLILAAIAVLMAAQASPLLAQQGGDPTQRRVTVKYDQADVRFVLKQLFDSVGVSYTLDPNVQGTVTVSLTDVPFTVALDNILRPLNLTYRVENGSTSSRCASLKRLRSRRMWTPPRLTKVCD